jgi:hypothetical protein
MTLPIISRGLSLCKMVVAGFHFFAKPQALIGMCNADIMAYYGLLSAESRSWPSYK